MLSNIWGVIILLPATRELCVCVCVEMMDGRMNDGWMKRQINELAD